jgi:hypothetical protein
MIVRAAKNKQKPNGSAAEEKGICQSCGHLWYVHFAPNGCVFYIRPSPVFRALKQNGKHCGCKAEKKSL